MPALAPDQVYQLLRNLTSPVVAITCQRAGTRNGMIADSAIRATIVPAIPRVSVYIHNFNFSHDLIFETGHFVLHLLRDDQFELIHQLELVVAQQVQDEMPRLEYQVVTEVEVVDVD